MTTLKKANAETQSLRGQEDLNLQMRTIRTISLMMAREMAARMSQVYGLPKTYKGFNP